MSKIKVLTDSCSDLGKVIRDKYDIGYVRMKTVYEGKETEASLDWEYYSPKELYDLMRDGKRVLTTQVPVEEFQRVFGELLEQGYDIVYVACSSKQSGSVNTGSVVAKELMAKYPDRKIFCIDSLNACMGEGALAVRAAEYRDAGCTAEEIAEKVTADRKKVNEFVTVHTLDYLKRAGRVKASAAFFGNMLGVKPILIADLNGAQTPIKKVKGREASLREIVALLKASMTNPEGQRVYIAHADCEEEAKFVKELVEKEIPGCEIYLDYIGPIVGSSIGPGAIGVFGFGTEVTFAI